jgi:hypothetical protein
MAEGYSAYFIDSDGHIFNRVDLFCETEEDAITRARMLVDGHPIELWQQTRKIATFEPERS